MGLLACTGAAALAPSPETSPAPGVRSSAPPARLPLELLWTGGLAAGYVSMNLKQNLRRRGHTDGDRRKRYSDLISLETAKREVKQNQTGKNRRGESPL